MNNMTPLVHIPSKSKIWEATKLILESILTHRELSDTMESKLPWPGFELEFSHPQAMLSWATHLPLLWLVPQLFF